MNVPALWYIVERMQGRIASQIRVLLGQPPLDQAQFDAPLSKQRRIIALRDAGRNASQSDEFRHGEWVEQHIADGWKYGETFNAAEKTHPNLVPWTQLKPEEQAKIRIFRIVAEATSEIDALMSNVPEDVAVGAVSGCGGHPVGPLGAAVSMGAIGPVGPVGEPVKMTPRQIASDRLDKEFVDYIRRYGQMPLSYLATDSTYAELERCGLLVHEKQACEKDDDRTYPPVIFGRIPVHRYCVEQRQDESGGCSYVVTPPYRSGFQPWRAGMWSLQVCPVVHLYDANELGNGFGPT